MPEVRFALTGVEFVVVILQILQVGNESEFISECQSNTGAEFDNA